MIDVSNIDSYPIELKKYIMSYLSKMPSDFIAKIKSKKIEYEIDIRCAIEDYLGPWRAVSLYEDLVSLMDKYDLIVYHGTKMLNKTMVLENGLKVNDWNRYSTLLFDTFNLFGMSGNDINETMEYVESEYERKYSPYDIAPQLYFFSGLNLIDGDIVGYEQFCESIGGEIARWALEEKHLEKYKLLKDNGEAFIVKFKLAFTDVVSFQKDIIAYQFVSHYAAKEFFDFSYQVKFDGATTKDVPSNNILEIIPYKNETAT